MTDEKRVIIVDVKGSTDAIKHMKELQKAAKNVDKNVTAMQKSFDKVGNAIKAFIAYRITAYIAGVVPAFLNMTDSVTLMTSRLEIATKEAGNHKQVMSELYEVAARGRSDIDATAVLFTRLTNATKDLSSSQQEILDFTETMNATFLLSGASAAEAASGVTQISQAMASGKLAGDEFKSVSENNIYFMNLLSKATGKNIGELREMAKAGLITTEMLIELGVNVDDVRKLVDDMPATTDQVATAWSNAFSRMWTDADDLREALSDINGWLIKVANNVGGLFSDKTGLKDELERLANERGRLDKVIRGKANYFETKDQTKLAEFTTFVLKKVIPAGTKLKEEFNFKDANLDHLREELKKTDTAIQYILKGMQAESTLPTIDVEGGGDGGGNGGDKKGKEIVTLTTLLRDMNEEQTHAVSIINELEAAHLAGKVSFEEYTAIYDQFHGKSGLTESALMAQANAHTELNKILEDSKSPLMKYIDELTKLEEWAEKYPELVEQVRLAQAQLAENFIKDDRPDEQNIIDWSNVAVNAIEGVAGAFVDMAMDGKNSFEDFAQSFLKNITKMIAQQLLLNAIKSATANTDFGKFLFPVTPKADGGVMSGPSISNYSNTVVNQPTLIPFGNNTKLMPMATGGALIGEAGSEAVMPLTRIGGDLGVKAEGMGSKTVVNVYNNGSGDEVTQTRSESNGLETISIMIDKQINESMNTGSLDRNMKKNYATPRVGY